jgi:hypothetical protein
MNKTTGIVLIIMSVLVAILFAGIAAIRPLTGLENVLLQVISLFLGMVGSYVLGRESASDAARELIKPHAKSAFRRLLSLYYGLSRLVQAIQTVRMTNSSEKISSILDKLEVMVIDQIRTADDALDDWHDIVPEDVDQIRDQIKKRQEMGVQND